MSNPLTAGVHYSLRFLLKTVNARMRGGKGPFEPQSAPPRASSLLSCLLAMRTWFRTRVMRCGASPVRRPPPRARRVYRRCSLPARSTTSPRRTARASARKGTTRRKRECVGRALTLISRIYIKVYYILLQKTMALLAPSILSGRKI